MPMSSLFPGASACVDIFNAAIQYYHVEDQVDQPEPGEVIPKEAIPGLLFRKCWIDTVQWHLEDIIRDPEIEVHAALAIKRRIDASNQARTDLVEHLDDALLADMEQVATDPGARINTESPAWALDRLSILCLKIYHMREESLRATADAVHQVRCAQKLAVLLEQQRDLMLAIDQLMEDLTLGRRIAKTYRQMKMYNDADLNPVLYKNT